MPLKYCDPRRVRGLRQDDVVVVDRIQRLPVRDRQAVEDVERGPVAVLGRPVERRVAAVPAVDVADVRDDRGRGATAVRLDVPGHLDALGVGRVHHRGNQVVLIGPLAPPAVHDHARTGPAYPCHVLVDRAGDVAGVVRAQGGVEVGADVVRRRAPALLPVPVGTVDRRAAVPRVVEEMDVRGERGRRRCGDRDGRGGRAGRAAGVGDGQARGEGAGRGVGVGRVRCRGRAAVAEVPARTSAGCRPRRRWPCR